jgi:hypothetical protein
MTALRVGQKALQAAVKVLDTGKTATGQKAPGQDTKKTTQIGWATSRVLA